MNTKLNTQDTQMRTHIAQLSIWTNKFSSPLRRLIHSSLQKITASEQNHLILSVYKPGDDRSSILLSMKKGESGISKTSLKPPTLNKPNSIVQIARKYIQGRKVTAAYATISPITIVIEVSDPNQNLENFQEISEGPNCLILDLDSKPPRIVVAKKYLELPKRYESQLKHNFNTNDAFFESWCEWSEENTKTKKRACFEIPLIGYCPYIRQNELEEIPVYQKNDQKELVNQEKTENKNFYPTNISQALEVFPTHIRKSIRTRMQFLARRIMRQKSDMPEDKEILRMQKQTEGLKTNLYLWPKNSLIWYVPPQFIEEFNMPPFYSLKKGEKPGDILNKTFHEIDILKRRKKELTVRIAESKKSELDFEKLIIEASQELKLAVDNYKVKNIALHNEPKKLERYALEYVVAKENLECLQRLCHFLDISPTESKEAKKRREEKEERLPFKAFFASTGEFIRVARSAEDGDKMIKLMPSNHTWIHVLTGEGSHVWLEKPKGGAPSKQAIREASILAIHHSKHSKAQGAEVQIATRADIEKRKNLPIGKVIVRRCETLLVKYENSEVQKLTAGSK